MKIYVGNLPFSVEESDLKELFSGYETEEVVLIKDKFNGRSKGFGFVTIPDCVSPRLIAARPCLHEAASDSRHQRPALCQRRHPPGPPGGIHPDRHLGPLPENART